MARATRRDSNYGENNHLSGAIETAGAAKAVAANSRGPLRDREGRLKQTETAVGLAAAYHEAGHIVAALTQSLVDHSAAFVRTVEFRGPIAHENAIRGPKLGLGKSDYARLCAGRAILVRLAGPAAQKRHAPRSWRSWHGEFRPQAGSQFGVKGVLISLGGSCVRRSAWDSGGRFDRGPMADRRARRERIDRRVAAFGCSNPPHRRPRRRRRRIPDHHTLRHRIARAGEKA